MPLRWRSVLYVGLLNALLQWCRQAVNVRAHFPPVVLQLCRFSVVVMGSSFAAVVSCFRDWEAWCFFLLDILVVSRASKSHQQSPGVFHCSCISRCISHMCKLFWCVPAEQCDALNTSAVLPRALCQMDSSRHAASSNFSTASMLTEHIHDHVAHAAQVLV